jgi:hypothetical protein
MQADQATLLLKVTLKFKQAWEQHVDRVYSELDLVRHLAQAELRVCISSLLAL